MGIERLACATEPDFTEKSVDYIEDCIVRFQDSRPGNFVLGLTGTNGRVRRARAADMMSALAARLSIDWGRVYVFLVDERYGFENEEDCNANLVRETLVKGVTRRRARFPPDHLIVPNTGIGNFQECAEEYGRRLCALLEKEAPDGPHLVTLGLGNDNSVAGIFPEWYRVSADRWAEATQKKFGVLCTVTQIFEVPQRISVNLRVLLKAEHCMLFLGDGSDETWNVVKRAFEKNMANNARDRGVKRARVVEPSSIHYSMEDGMIVVQAKRTVRRGRSARLMPDSPLGYVLTHGHVTVVQLKVDQETAYAFIVLGAAGDLAKKKTFVSLFHLHLARCLPTTLSIIGCDDPAFHADITDTNALWEKRLKEYLEAETDKSQQDLADFRSRLSFMPVRYNEPETWRALDQQIRDLAKGRRRDNRVYYLALPSFLFGVAVQQIREHVWSKTGFGHVIVEKPFGRNQVEAQALSGELSRYLEETNIFRIDHYLAKTLVLNILALRFANRELGSLFHAHHVANVRITFKEDVGVAGRAGYFDNYGIIRDIMQNHLMQVLTLIAMEAPASLKAEDVRDEKVKVLKQIRPISAEDCVIGQYIGYQDDAGIQRINAEKGYPSRTPTFALAVLYLDNERWSGVPFIMKAGKLLENRHTIVRVQFKKAPPGSLFGDQPQNELVIRIQPNEAIYYKMLAKMPGLSQSARDVQQTVLDLDLKKRFEMRRLPEAYEKLIHDVLQGESHNFVRADELQQAWRIFDPLLHKLEVEEKRVPEPYAIGSRGPMMAERLIDRMGFRRYTVSGVPGFAEEDYG